MVSVTLFSHAIKMVNIFNLSINNSMGRRKLGYMNVGLKKA